MARKRRRIELGNAMVEAALTLTLFLTIVFSLFDFGFDLWKYQTIVSSARSAIRYGATHPADTSGIKDMFLYGQTTAGTNALFGLASGNVAVARSAAGSNDDRLTISITGFTFNQITMAWAGKKSGYPVTVAIGVEN